jgi:REP element-mobilizing transposase RayT
MSKEIYQNRYRIPSVRAAWHNYNDGMYFVTICTKDRKHHFGEITSSEERQQMILSPIGKFTDEQFQHIQNHYPYAEIPLWVVMPNHIHSIITIYHNKTPYERRNIAGTQGYENIPETRINAIPAGTSCKENFAGTRCIDNSEGMRCIDNFVEPWCNDNFVEPWCTAALQNVQNDTTSYQRQIANMQGWLSVVVGGLKRSVTHFANQCHTPFAWQTRFYDRIIRNKNEENHIAKYIENNIANWKQDMFYGV